ncbi:hypothetical protein [Curtobacterium sp. MCPF17_052]|uniref:hypothetical protein n=1 Tax=Curtobacterium sp. MCPF17_052 TaxID=2175655 RepID=UPI0024E02026|nr:hypothetical protein [Curtobacterium sp. MCPF17_052]WIB11544.1 hypothetical protein DEJ36_11255 [Curtobacterium sp. MCPF17_052]
MDHEQGPHGDEVRRRSASLIVQRLSVVDGPVLFAGDCNEPAGAGAAAQVFADAGYTDAWTVAGGPGRPHGVLQRLAATGRDRGAHRLGVHA